MINYYITYYNTYYYYNNNNDYYTRNLTNDRGGSLSITRQLNGELPWHISLLAHTALFVHICN